MKGEEVIDTHSGSEWAEGERWERGFRIHLVSLWRESVPLLVARVLMSLGRRVVTCYHLQSQVRGSTFWERGYIIDK